MNTFKKLHLLTALGIAATTPACVFTGCDTLQSLWEQTPDAVKDTAVTLGKAAAKLALNIGFTAFLDGVNETDPYRDHLLTLLDAVDEAFETGANAAQAASAVVSDIESAPLPDDEKTALIKALMTSLENQSTAEATTVGATPASGENYGGVLYQQLFEARNELVSR